MKLVGIITFATHHQQQPDCHDHNATKHPQIIFFFKNGE
jgi:hypothetical protein